MLLFSRGVFINPNSIYISTRIPWCVYFIYCSISNWGHNIQGGCGYTTESIPTTNPNYFVAPYHTTYIYTQRNVLLLCFCCYCLKPLLVMLCVVCVFKYCALLSSTYLTAKMLTSYIAALVHFLPRFLTLKRKDV